MLDASDSDEGSGETQPLTAAMEEQAARKSREKKKKKTLKHPGGSKYKDVIVLYDHDGKKFYAYNDPDMIRWLGKGEFNTILRFSPSGLVKDVSS
jgi:hypothetical protein